MVIEGRPSVPPPRGRSPLIYNRALKARCVVGLYRSGVTQHRGHAADNIPLGAKIISVVDCFDAITSDRPYQKRKSLRQAFRILRQLSGTSLQPSLVETFIEEVENNGMIPDGPTDFFSAVPNYPFAVR